MKTRLLVLSLLIAATAACASHKTQRVPTVTGPQAPQQPQPDVAKQIGDGAWNVVTAPARLVTPTKRDKKDPEVYQTPTATFTKRSYGDEDTPSTPAPAPATSPAKLP